MSTPVSGASGAPSCASAPSSSPSVSSSAPSPASSPSSSSAPASASSSSPSVPAGKEPGKAAVGGSGDQPDLSAKPGESATQTEQRVQEEIRKLKLKVNGREVEMTEPEVIRRAQLAEAADQKFREAADARKQTEQFWEMLLTNPKAVLLHPDLRDKINFREIAEEYLGTELKRELMSPEERELADLREWKRQQDETRASQEQETLTKTQQAEMTRLQQRAAADYEQKIMSALQNAQVPKTPHTVKRIAQLMHDALQKGYELDVPTAVDMVREGYTTDLQSMVSGLDGDALISFLGDDLVKKLRKSDLARIKAQLGATEAPQPAPNPLTAPAQSRQSADGERHYKPDEWKEMLRRKAGV